MSVSSLETRLGEADYELLSAHQRLIADRLLDVPVEITVRWFDIAPELTSQQSGVALQQLHRRGFVTRHGRPSGPKTWEASWGWRALMMARIAQRMEQDAAPRQLLLPSPPSTDSPDRYEQLTTFRAFQEALMFFEGCLWQVVFGSAGDSHTLIVSGRAVAVYEDRITQPFITRQDQEVELETATIMFFSRRAFRGARFDRCMQELVVFQEGKGSISIEFMPDGMND
jgi:hypothetical protein